MLEPQAVAHTCTLTSFKYSDFYLHALTLQALLLRVRVCWNLSPFFLFG